MKGGETRVLRLKANPRYSRRPDTYVGTISANLYANFAHARRD